jgi:hypothetical protein
MHEKKKKEKSRVMPQGIIHPGHLRRQPLIQRKHFLGALRYKHNRPPAKAVQLILLKCLKAAEMSLSEQTECLGEFFGRCPISEGEFWKDAYTDWRFSSDAGNRVFEVLKCAFYDGTIDDLWLSVFGIKKLSCIAKANDHPKAKKRRRRRHRRRHGSVWIVSTGQTPKPGSHSSDR